MAANTSPIFTLTPDVSNNNSTGFAGSLTAAANEYDGTSASNVLVHTAGTNGSYTRKLRFKAKGTNVATVARIFLNNGAAHTTASNNKFFGEVSLPATSANASNSTPEIEYFMDVPLAAGFTIWVGLETAVAAGWDVTSVSGQY